jgi:diacylglycerol kinase family enzyme
VPIGILDGKHVFLLAACFGRIAEITLQTKPALKRMLGFGAYVVAGARKVFHFPHEHLQLRSDDGERAVYAHSFLVFTPGFSRIALPTADATQRSLQSLVLTNRSPVGLAHTLWDLFVRRRRGKRMLHLTGPWFTVRSGMVRTVHLDGDEVELLADECRMEILPTNQLFLLSKTQN